MLLRPASNKKAWVKLSDVHRPMTDHTGWMGSGFNSFKKMEQSTHARDFPPRDDLFHAVKLTFAMQKTHEKSLGQAWMRPSGGWDDGHGIFSHARIN